MNQYDPANVCAFKKVNEQWGEFSNMAAFPLNVNRVEVRTSEALYQAMRYPHLPEVQQEIIAQKSPMAAKMKSKPHRKSDTHQLFLDHQLGVMEWCVRLKIAQHYAAFSSLFRQTEGRAIVEDSHKDKFWGAVRDQNTGLLVGENQLGRILTKIRDEFLLDKNSIRSVPALGLEGMSLLGKSLNFTYQAK
ncbi:MAG: NADAR family protein [Cyclobacteriaceae bacterium]